MNNTQNNNEIERLLNELKSMQNASSFNPKNNKEFWRTMSDHGMDFASIGFKSDAEMQLWISENPYANIS